MAVPKKYRKIRKVNDVTIVLGAIALVLGLIIWEMGPAWLVRMETNRVVKSYAERFVRHRSRYLEREQEFESLINDFSRDLYRAGVADPKMEYWIEIDEQSQAELGVSYVQTLHWPFNIGTPIRTQVEQTQDASIH